MKYLNRKLRRDVQRSWSQFFSVFLMAFLSILMFVGLQGSWRGLEVSLNQYINQTHLANYWIQATNVTDNDLDKLKSLSGVRRVYSGTRLQAKQGSRQIIVDTISSSANKLHVVSGQKVNESTNGIWLNYEYAKAHHLKAGETTTVKYGEQAVKLKITGIVQSSDRIYFTGTQEYIAPNYDNYAYAYISNQTLRTQFHYQGPQNIVEIRGNHSHMRSAIEKTFGSR